MTAFVGFGAFERSDARRADSGIVVAAEADRAFRQFAAMAGVEQLDLFTSEEIAIDFHAGSVRMAAGVDAAIVFATKRGTIHFFATITRGGNGAIFKTIKSKGVVEHETLSLRRATCLKMAVVTGLNHRAICFLTALGIGVKSDIFANPPANYAATAVSKATWYVLVAMRRKRTTVIRTINIQTETSRTLK